MLGLKLLDRDMADGGICTYRKLLVSLVCAFPQVLFAIAFKPFLGKLLEFNVSIQKLAGFNLFIEFDLLSFQLLGDLLLDQLCGNLW